MNNEGAYLNGYAFFCVFFTFLQNKKEKRKKSLYIEVGGLF